MLRCKSEEQPVLLYSSSQMLQDKCKITGDDDNEGWKSTKDKMSSHYACNPVMMWLQFTLVYMYRACCTQDMQGMVLNTGPVFQCRDCHVCMSGKGVCLMTRKVYLIVRTRSTNLHQCYCWNRFIKSSPTHHTTITTNIIVSSVIAEQLSFWILRDTRPGQERFLSFVTTCQQIWSQQVETVQVGGLRQNQTQCMTHKLLYTHCCLDLQCLSDDLDTIYTTKYTGYVGAQETIDETHGKLRPHDRHSWRW